jgi:membrane protein implicated in regulation of membrane protease activity
MLFPDLTQYMWLVWLGFILVCVIIELLTLQFTFLMMGAGSLGGLGANLLGWEWWVQILVALLLSVLLLLLIRPVLMRLTQKGADPTPSNIAALSGMAGRVVVPLTELGGQVKLENGETWTARLDESAASAVLDIGSTVAVTAIRGSTAVVVPTERSAER